MPKPTRPKTLANFVERVDLNGPTVRDGLGPCHVWTWSCYSSGYGAFYDQGKRWNAHAWHWNHVNGPLPEGKPFLCHRCDNRACVRLDHLFPGSPGDNMRDMHAKGRGRPHTRDKTHCPAGHPYDSENTYLYQGRRYCRACHVQHNRNHRARHK